MQTKLFVRSAAILVFGVLVPIVLLIQAYTGLSGLNDAVSRAIAKDTPAEQIAKARAELRSANDFALFSMMSAERANQVVMVNKQVMKVVVMQIGFAVSSMGLMFVMLGINDGGGSAAMGGTGLTFDFKTGSTGALVFVIGAAMATAGGVLRNEYKTVQVPQFTANGDAAGGYLQAYAELADTRASCAKLGGSAAEQCFYQTFEQLHARVKK
ncbi:MAG: hypothetical protein EOP62_10460 [Sphingomonadales bacterium]|nr:MAG: hypothetical protein EOP62_10460 [Sphingomonadales bacterium]